MSTHVDLAIIGSGSANSIPDEAFADRQVALIEQGVFGGTCLNRGCIPTKMFVYPADLAEAAAHGQRLGVHSRLDGVGWRAVRDRVFTRIDPISRGGRSWRAEGAENVRLYEGHARFVGERTIDTGTGEVITADQVVLATGSRPVVPPLEGLDRVHHHTSDTVMRIEERPERVLVLGGGYVSAELSHVFSAFGARVTVVNRSPLLLGKADRDVSRAFTDQVSERWDLRLGRVVDRLEPLPDGALEAHLDDGSSVVADLLLVATGRVPNSDDLGLEVAGVRVDEHGLVVVDEHQRTSAAGIWALGDVSSPWQLKHVANAEARVVRHNLLHPDDLRAADHQHVPSAVFSSPQVASVGLTEQQLEAAGRRYVSARQSYGDVAYGWAMEETRGFVKLLADPGTGLLLGAHLIGPQASNLIQPLVQAISLGQRVPEVASGQYWIHPALMEVVENALLALSLD